MEGRGVLVGDLRVYLTGAALGFQDCPWGCDILGFDRGGWSDFRLRNEITEECIGFPALIIHLVREHGFFEGEGSPYRVHPMDVIRVLELRPCRD